MSGPPPWLVMIGAAGNTLAALVLFGQGNPACLLFACLLGINTMTLLNHFTKGGRSPDPHRKDTP
jgi:hypothetical protein